MSGERLKEVKPPAPNPCGSCPYRRDAPSGLWSEDEYAKLPEYDLPCHAQPPLAFFCHQSPDRICAGWAGVHDMTECLGLRILVSINPSMSVETIDAIVDYKTDTPLFSSGAEAAAHGMKELECPSTKTRETAAKIRRKRAKSSHPAEFSR